MMQTRCPSCATAFRVTPEQLKARQGKVRCGQCQHVFNALDSLLDAPPLQQPVPMPVPEVYVEPEPKPPILEAPPEAPEEEPVPEPALAPVLGEDQSVFVVASEPVTVDENAATLQVPAAEMPEPAPTEETSWQAQPPEPLLHEVPAAPATRPRVWPLLLGTVLALLFLLLQTVVHFRTELAVLAPEAKPALRSLSALLGLDLPLPRKPNLVSIEISDLHPDPKIKDTLLLATTLKNRAPFVQAYPHLELTLTDAADQPLIRKVLSPLEYLASIPPPNNSDAAAGFAANGEIALNITLAFDGGAVAASGYRLYLFYP